MTTIGTLIIGAVVSLGALFGINSLIGTTPNVGGGTGTINQLQQFVATTSPVSAITQAVFGKSFRLSGQSTGCAQFDSNGVLTSSGVACGSGGGIGWASTTIPNSNSIYSTAVSNVGIGTTTPDAKLHVAMSNGAFPTLGSDTGAVISNTTSAGSSAALSIIAGTTGFSTLNFGDSLDENVGYIQYGHTNNYLAFGASTNEYMRIISSGNVGIGTTSPGNKLSLFKSTGSLISSIQSGNSAWTGVKIGDAADPMTYWNSGSNFRWGVTTANDGVTGFSEYMRISSTGNLGIGTTSPWTRLAVTGSTTIAGGPLIVLGTSNTPIGADTDWYRGLAQFRKDINDYMYVTIENRNGGANASSDFIWNNDRTTSTTYYADAGFNSSGYNNPSYGNLNVPNGWYLYNTDGPAFVYTATTSPLGYIDFGTGGYSSSRMRITSTGNIGIGTTTPQSTLSVGSVNDATNSYAQIDSVNGAPTAGDCDTDLERGRMIIDYSNNRFYICNGATRGWDYSALTD